MAGDRPARLGARTSCVPGSAGVRCPAAPDPRTQHAGSGNGLHRRARGHRAAAELHRDRVADVLLVAQGLLTTAAALAVMLGADVGTAIMVQVFALDLRWIAPLAIVVGVVVYLSRRNERAGQIGRIVLGFGVMILALQLITAADSAAGPRRGGQDAAGAVVRRHLARRASSVRCSRDVVLQPGCRAAGCHACRVERAAVARRPAAGAGCNLGSGLLRC